MGFLESSDTALAVLVTLTVLCLFFDQNNFVHNLLKDLKDEVYCKSRILFLSYVNQAKEKIKMDEKTIKFFSSVAIGDDLANKGLVLYDKIQLETVRLEVEHQKGLDILGDVLEKILNGKEFLLSFLYSFLYCIVVFLVNELCVVYSDYSVIFMNLLCILTIVSFLFWIITWGYYWKNIKKREPAPVYYIFNHRWIYFFPFIFPLSGILIYIGLNSLIDYMTHRALSPIYIFIFYIGFALVVGIVALYKFRKSSYDCFSTHFMLSHFIIICISSAVFVIFLFNMDSYKGFLFLDKSIVRYLSLLFAFTNGLVFPFCIPLFRFLRSNSHVKKRLRMVQLDYNNKKVKFDEDLMSYQQDVIKAHSAKG